MPIKIQYDTVDDVPETFAELYTERDGKYVLTGVEGMKTQKDIDNLAEALRKERADHKAIREKFSIFADKDLDEIQTQLDSLPALLTELETLKDPSRDPANLDALVEARAKARMTPLERQLAELTGKYNTATGERDALNSRLVRKQIEDVVRAEALKTQVVSTALDDIIQIAGSIFELTDTGEVRTKDTGLDASLWFSEQKDKRPHWWPTTTGADADGNRNGGGFPNNPWSPKHWNLTAQGQVVATKGRETAERMAAAAGSSLGARKPAAV